MTKDEAVLAAEAFVTRNYPKLPQVVMVSHLTEREDRLFVECWMQMPGSARWRESARWLDESSAEVGTLNDQFPDWKNAARGLGIIGMWTVTFFMSWDTDAVGMPQTLAVRIDDADGRVTPM